MRGVRGMATRLLAEPVGRVVAGRRRPGHSLLIGAYDAGLSRVPQLGYD